MTAKKTEITLDGVKLTPLSTNEVIESIAESLAGKNKSFMIIYLNAYVYCLARRNKELNDIISESDIIVSDGISIVLATYFIKKIRISQSIMTHVFDQFLITPLIPPCKGILIGTTEAEAIRAMEEINRKSKNIRIYEAYSGFCNNDQYSEILKNHTDSDFILIGMSSPKSEFLCKRAMIICKKSIVWHIGGGTIMCYAGSKRRPPKWVIKLHVEWIHRFIFEKHTRKRYFKYNFMFLYFLAVGMIRKWRTKMSFAKN
jgi:N-acetylglucosaminyldiphosphoundecaprenol N-acetyl-beta-D-mannosaminyltransferase